MFFLLSAYRIVFSTAVRDLYMVFERQYKKQNKKTTHKFHKDIQLKKHAGSSRPGLASGSLLGTGSETCGPTTGPHRPGLVSC